VKELLSSVMSESMRFVLKFVFFMVCAFGFIHSLDKGQSFIDLAFFIACFLVVFFTSRSILNRPELHFLSKTVISNLDTDWAYLKALILAVIVGLANYPLPMVEDALSSADTNYENLLANCEIALEAKASLLILSCAIRIYYEYPDDPAKLAQSFNYAEKALVLSRAAPIIKFLQPRYATTYACIAYKVRGPEIALEIASAFELQQQSSLFRDGHDCGNKLYSIDSLL
jgi:hypothetical protein